MKKLIYLLFLPLIFSCGGNSSDKAKSGNILENLTFTVDTVLIDSGQELVDLSGDIRLADFSKDLRTLYLLGQKNKVL